MKKNNVSFFVTYYYTKQVDSEPKGKPVPIIETAICVSPKMETPDPIDSDPSKCYSRNSARFQICGNSNSPLNSSHVSVLAIT